MAPSRWHFLEGSAVNPAMSKITRVCFVCLGNICRSPTAEGVFRDLVEREGLASQIEIDSAGTAAYHIGKRADPRSRAHAAKRGFDLTSIARQFVGEDFERFDYVLAMDTQNLRDLRELLRRRGATRLEEGLHLGLFREFDATSEPGASVPDPYYGGESGFEEVLDQCLRASRGLLDAIVLSAKGSGASR